MRLIVVHLLERKIDKIEGETDNCTSQKKWVIASFVLVCVKNRLLPRKKIGSYISGKKIKSEYDGIEWAKNGNREGEDGSHKRWKVSNNIT